MKKNNFIGKSFITDNFKETQKLAYDFAKILESGDVVCLYGDLGGGKTTFTQGLAEGLGIKSRIISPTFVIVRSHNFENGILYHIDMYRIENEKDIESLGLQEKINDKQNITVIEWAEKLKNKLPQKRIDVEFSYKKENVRKITFRSLNQ
jgi:tRNA threonylcarbamoyladenosine biosynthesis protein TsaE